MAGFQYFFEQLQGFFELFKFADSASGLANVLALITAMSGLVIWTLTIMRRKVHRAEKYAEGVEAALYAKAREANELRLQLERVQAEVPSSWMNTARMQLADGDEETAAHTIQAGMLALADPLHDACTELARFHLAAAPATAAEGLLHAKRAASIAVLLQPNGKAARRLLGEVDALLAFHRMIGWSMPPLDVDVSQLGLDWDAAREDPTGSVKSYVLASQERLRAGHVVIAERLAWRGRAIAIALLSENATTSLKARTAWVLCLMEDAQMARAATELEELLPLVNDLADEDPRFFIQVRSLQFSLGLPQKDMDPLQAIAQFVEFAEAKLGSSDIDTLTAKQIQIQLFDRAGEYVAAYAYSVLLLPDCIKVKGPSHPDTFMARAFMFAALMCCGQAEAAALAFGVLAAEAVDQLGNRHPRVLTIRRLHAKSLRLAGQEQRSKEAYETLIPELELLMGTDSIDVKLAKDDLASMAENPSDPSPVCAAPLGS